MLSNKVEKCNKKRKVNYSGLDGRWRWNQSAKDK